MISLKHKFLFIHVPKTAGNSIQRVLLPFSGDKIALLAPHHDGVNHFDIRSPTLDIHKHSSLSEYQAQLRPDLFESLFKFSCTRNPWDRCVSFFFSPHRGLVKWSPKEFERFIVDNVRQTDAYLQLSDGRQNPFENVDSVIHFENLNDDLEKVCQHLGIQGSQLPRINESNRSDYRRYYETDHLVEIVASKFKLEIETFGYRFG